MKQIHTKEYEKIEEAVETLNITVDQYNDLIFSIREMLETELEQLNLLREKIVSTEETIEKDVRSLVEDMEGYYEDRSEKWQESENGEQYQEWTVAWSDILSELPDVPEEVEVDHFNDLLVEVEMEDDVLPPRKPSDL